MGTLKVRVEYTHHDYSVVKIAKLNFDFLLMNWQTKDGLSNNFNRKCGSLKKNLNFDQNSSILINNFSHFGRKIENVPPKNGQTVSLAKDQQSTKTNHSIARFVIK